MVDRAIIFDVDGVLLTLTPDEEELFFAALSKFVPVENLSRDWNSYRIRNDENIIAEVLERNGLPASHLRSVIDHYIATLKSSFITSVPIAGAAHLLTAYQNKAHLGIATANLREAAKHRLERANLWQPVSHYAFGADGGGHKTEILARALQAVNLPRNRVVYIGDNLNDVEAGLHHGVQFIGFSTSDMRLQHLREGGAQHVSRSHTETMVLINTLLP